MNKFQEICAIFCVAILLLLAASMGGGDSTNIKIYDENFSYYTIPSDEEIVYESESLIITELDNGYSILYRKNQYKDRIAIEPISMIFTGNGG